MRPLIDRRAFLSLAGSAAVTLGVAGCTSSRSVEESFTNRRPNVLVLFTDDQRADTIGALGNHRIITPNMDRLVECGVSFTNAYVMGSIHGAVCMPSRAMLLTGRHYFNLPRSVTMTWDVPHEQRGACSDVTLPELYQQAGYETFVTGKWHNGAPLLARGFTNGDAIFFGGMCDHLSVPIQTFDPTGRYHVDRRYNSETFSSELFSDAAIEFLESRTDERPFFLYLSYTAPHDPRMAPEEFAALYPPESIELPANYMDEHPYLIGDLDVRDEKLAPLPRSAAIIREHIAAYYAMITHLDVHIGRVLDALEATGEADNTIIVLAGDNGLAVGQHGLLGKQNIYEHSAGVPLVMSGPGIPHGEVREGLCYIHDIFPTLCELSGLPTPASVEAKSLTPLMQNTTGEIRDSILLSYSTGPIRKSEGNSHQPDGILRGVRQGRWKLIKSSCRGSINTRLYNLDTDPCELQDLSDHPAHRAQTLHLEKLLQEWMVRTGDPVDPRWLGLEVAE